MSSLDALKNASIRSTCLANLLFHFSTQPLVASIELSQGCDSTSFSLVDRLTYSLLFPGSNL
jgi:hypothetical protein